MKYAQLDANGAPVAFYSTDIHGPLNTDGVRNPLIPTGVVEISDDVWMDCLNNPGRRRWNGGKMIVFTPPLQTVDLLAYAKQLRWEKEVGGFKLGGMDVATDDRSKVLIMGARLRADSDPSTTEDWDTADGVTVVLDAQMIIALSDAMAAHVSAVFKIFSKVKADIADGTITTTEEIDAAFG